MTENENKIKRIDWLEVVESLLDVIVTREKEINDLMDEIESLRSVLSTSGTKDVFPKDKTDKSAGILIVDPSDLMCTKLKDLFVESGFTVVGSAKTGDEAINIFRKFNPLLVTMDPEIPGKNAFQVVKEMIEMNPNAKVVIISRTMDKTRIVLAMSAGACEFLFQPINPQRLVELLRKLSVS